MSPKLTQKEIVLRALRTTKNRKMTQAQARDRLGVMSLSSCVSKLRNDGYPIVTQPFTRKEDGHTLVRYSLAE